jgi:ABC-type transport system involved in cytochrome c biogenesis permease subunit
LEIILTYLGIGAYILASLLSVDALLRSGKTGRRSILLLVALGAALLAGVLVARAVRAGCLPVFSRCDALTCYSLALTVAYLYMATRRRTRGVAGILVPYVTLMLLLAAPASGTAPTGSPPVRSLWLGLHVLTGFVGYALFSLSGVVALAYLVQDRNLKHKRLGGTFERLPALETLDHLMSRQVGFAFVMLTVSIILGFALVRLTGGGQGWLTDPKVAATLGTWAVYAVLVHMRATAGRHGKGLALVTVLGFCCVLFAFIGIHALANSVHDYILIGIPVK